MAEKSIRAALSTPFGAPLHIRELKMTEAISQPFRIELSLAADPGYSLPWSDVMGAKFHVVVTAPAGETHWDGVVEHFSAIGGDPTYLASFHATLVPRFALLRCNLTSRVFHQQTVRQIVEKVLGEHGIDFEFTVGDHPERNYCVQYQESDFAFVSRLLEEEGFSYVFEHRADGHKMRITDTPALKEPVGAYAFEPTTGDVDTSRIHFWSRTQQMRAAKATLWDSHFEKPLKNFAESGLAPDESTLGSTKHRLRFAANERLERREWPSFAAVKFDSVDRHGQSASNDLPAAVAQESRRLAAIRMEEHLADAVTFQGRSNVFSFHAGATFELKRSPDADGKHLIVRIEHTLHLPDPRAGAGDTTKYENSFTAVAGSCRYRPPRMIPRPRIDGVHPAIVVSGFANDDQQWNDTVRTDRFGRIRVRFPWADHQASCWVRSSQAWANRNTGAFHFPLVGDEVLVAYVDGCPDWPIVVGTVYNGDRPAPYPLPGEHPHSGIKSLQEYYIQGLRNLSIQAKEYKVERTGKGVTVRIGFPEDSSSSAVTTAIDSDIDNSRSTEAPIMPDSPRQRRLGSGAGGADSEDDGIGSGAGGSDGSEETNLSFFDFHVNGWSNMYVSGWREVNVGGDRRVTVGGNKALAVQNSGELHVFGDTTVLIDGGADLTVDEYSHFVLNGDETISADGYILEHWEALNTTSIEGDFERTVGVDTNGPDAVANTSVGDDFWTIKGNVNETVSGDLNVTVNQKRKFTIAGDMTVNCGNDYVVDSASSDTEKQDVYAGDAWVKRTGVQTKLNDPMGNVITAYFTVQTKQFLGPKFNIPLGGIYMEAVTGVQMGALFGLKMNGINTYLDLSINQWANVHAETAWLSTNQACYKIGLTDLQQMALKGETIALNSKTGPIVIV